VRFSSPFFLQLVEIWAEIIGLGPHERLDGCFEKL
jgi:hypothetical protein